MDYQRQPEGSEAIASQHVARPVRAEVNARDPDQTYQRAEDDEQRGAEPRRRRQCVDEVKQKPVKRHVRRDVARRKAFGDGRRIDLDHVLRRARPPDEKLERVDQEPTRSQAYQQPGRFDLQPEPE